MRNLIFIFLLLFKMTLVFGQSQTINVQNGITVKLNPDGTWKYIKDVKNDILKLDTNGCARWIKTVKISSESFITMKDYLIISKDREKTGFGINLLLLEDTLKNSEYFKNQTDKYPEGFIKNKMGISAPNSVFSNTKKKTADLFVALIIDQKSIKQIINYSIEKGEMVLQPIDYYKKFFRKNVGLEVPILTIPTTIPTHQDEIHHDKKLFGENVDQKALESAYHYALKVKQYIHETLDPLYYQKHPGLLSDLYRYDASFDQKAKIGTADEIAKSQNRYTDKDNHWVTSEINGYYSLSFSITIIGIRSCIDVGDKIDIIFKDGTIMELYSEGDSNCKGEATVYFGGLYGKNKQLEILSAKKINALKVWTNDRFFEEELKSAQAEQLMNAFMCLSKIHAYNIKVNRQNKGYVK